MRFQRSEEISMHVWLRRLREGEQKLVTQLCQLWYRSAMKGVYESTFILTT